MLIVIVGVLCDGVLALSGGDRCCLDILHLCVGVARRRHRPIHTSIKLKNCQNNCSIQITTPHPND
ncbi:MAG: hypothetical protein V7L20_04325 [Nostoc sp.]